MCSSSRSGGGQGVVGVYGDGGERVVEKMWQGLRDSKSLGVVGVKGIWGVGSQGSGV